MAGAVQQHAVAAFGAEDEAALDQLGHDVDRARRPAAWCGRCRRPGRGADGSTVWLASRSSSALSGGLGGGGESGGGKGGEPAGQGLSMEMAFS